MSVRKTIDMQAILVVAGNLSVPRNSENDLEYTAQK